MFHNNIVDVPVNNHKIVIRTKSSGVYVDYEYDRIYDPERKYTNAKRTTIGKICSEDKTKMYPNDNYVKFFGMYELPEKEVVRSSCLKVGAFLVLEKFVREYKLEETFKQLFNENSELLLDLAIYSIITENNVAQYYGEYAYNHPLISSYMKIYSDSTISNVLKSIPKEKFIEFIKIWNKERDKEEKIYVSYDSTNKVCQSGEIDLVEEGRGKNGNPEAVINYSIAYDCKNQEALLYENYPGSITDIIQLQTMIDKVSAFGYKNIGFILDRGYFSKKNIIELDKKGYNFVIMVKGCKDIVIEEVKANKGKFESKWKYFSEDYEVFGITKKRKLYLDDNKDRYFHIYYNASLALTEREQLLKKVLTLKKSLSQKIGKVLDNEYVYEKYFNLRIGKDGKLALFKEKTSVIEQELNVSGYFAIVTSEKMTAIEAIKLYKGRDASEKLFRADKSFLGDGAYRVASSEAQETKVFIEFIALVLRNKFYRCLKNTMKGNTSTVPAALRELEKIELIKLLDEKYYLDNPLTKTQKTILDACGISVGLFKEYIKKLQDRLNNLSEVKVLVRK